MNPNLIDENPRGIIYARVSTDKQAKEGHGIETQIQICSEYAKKNGIEIIGIYKDEGVSGGKKDREGLETAISFAKSQNNKYTKVKYFLVFDIDRIMRDLYYWMEKKLVIEKKCGMQIVSMKQNLEDSPESRMLTNVTMSIKQYERENNARRVKDCIRGRLLGGYRPFAEVPLGYKRQKVHEGGKQNIIAVPNEGTFDIMKKGLEMFASGILESTTDLYKYLKENNIKSNSPKNPITLHQSIIYRLLEEKRLYFYGGYILKPDYGISQPIEAKHQAMINDYTMYKILEKLKLNKRPIQERETALDGHYPLRGIIRCKECGSKFTARKSKGKGGKYFYYYGCRNPKCNFGKKSVPISKIHFEYLEIINKISPKDNILQMAEVIFENAFNLEKEQGSAQKKSIESKLKSIKSELSNIENVLINIKQPELIKKYENKWEALNIEKRSLEEESKSDFYCEDNYKALFDGLLNVIKNPNSIWNLGNVELIQLFSRVRFDGPITYDWNEGLQTPGNSNLNLLFRPLEGGEFP